MRRVSGKRGALVVLVGMISVAAACGSDDSSDSGAGQADQTTTSAANEGAAASTTAPSASSADPKNMDEWEALWEKQRAAIVKRIKDNKWGLQADGKTVTGPEGFQIDLNKCQVDWSNTEGL